MSKIKIEKKADIEAREQAQAAKAQARQTLIDKLKTAQAQGPLKDLIELVLMDKQLDEQD
jgi:hypothetical protein